MAIRAVCLAVALALVGLLGLVNFRAHQPGDLETTIAQLRFLEQTLASGAAGQMQQIFPEGYVFTWALYGLASAQVASQLGSADARQVHHLEEAKRAVREVRSERARSTFDARLEPPYGAFYSSWSLYLLAEYIRAAGPARIQNGLLAVFQDDCARLADALNHSESPFLASYPDASWPADTAVGIGALGIHDRVLPPRYRETIDLWIAKARARLDDEVAAIGHEAESRTGAAKGGARGSSLALMSRVLIDADPPFAAEQYSALRRHFVDYRWGVPGVREYPHGDAGRGDVDSGPLLLGYSGPAVVVGAAAARVHGDQALARALLGVVEVGGVPIELAGRRRYAGGFVPVGDAFIAWSRSSPLPRKIETEQWDSLVPEWWAVPEHALSAILATLVLLPALRHRRRRNPRGATPLGYRPGRGGSR